MPTLSISIITKNEADNIQVCLESISWADEIVIVDTGSVDDTLTICRKYTDKVFVDPDWQGFGIQKNRALDKTTGDWVLSLDADEVVTPELATEIKHALAQDDLNQDHHVYEIPRLSTFCGKEIRHSGWYPDYVARLFRRSSASFSDDKVHERLVFAGQPARLNNPLKHNTAPDLHHVIEKMNRYSSISAEKKSTQGKQTGLLSALGHGMWAFLWSYFGRVGFMDGREGFILAVTKAENSYYRYLKLMYLNIDKNK